MKDLKKLLISFCIIIGINYSFIFCFAYSREVVYDVALHKCNIEQIIKQENDFVKFNDYTLLNWGYGDKEQSATDVINILKNSDYEVVGKFEQVAIRFLQNRWNSIVYIWMNPDNHKKFDYRWLKQAEGAAKTVEVVEILGQYYLINSYLVEGSVAEDNKAGAASDVVYKAISPDKINDIKEHKGTNRYFGSYSFYPIDLSPFVSTFFGKVLNISFVLLETFIVYKTIKRFSKDKKTR